MTLVGAVQGNLIEMLIFFLGGGWVLTEVTEPQEKLSA